MSLRHANDHMHKHRRTAALVLGAARSVGGREEKRTTSRLDGRSFCFDGIRATAVGARVARLGYDDFPLAKQAYQQQCDIDELVASEKD